MAETKRPCVVLGVTGSIAAFRAADLASAMVQKGWDVHAVLTADGERFLPALTLAALTHRSVHTSLWEEGKEGRMGHLDLAREADVVVVAPASADCIASNDAASMSGPTSVPDTRGSPTFTCAYARSRRVVSSARTLS